jgi:hypothetical protein
MGDSPPVPTPSQGLVIAASCLGRLGRWGNQVFQWAALRLAAELHEARFLCPDWPGRHVLVRASLRLQDCRGLGCKSLTPHLFAQLQAALDALLTADEEAALPLCADRPVLSHAGWRAWAQEQEPLRSLLTSQPASAGLSGHQARTGCCSRLCAGFSTPVSMLTCDPAGKTATAASQCCNAAATACSRPSRPA